MIRYLAALWLLPIAIPIWLLFVLPAWGLGLIKPATRVGLSVVFIVLWPQNPLGLFWLRRWEGWTGLALPFCILVTSDSERLIAHELRHCDQWLALGPLFPVVYGVLTLLYGYEANPLEADARRAEASEVTS